MSAHRFVFICFFIALASIKACDAAAQDEVDGLPDTNSWCIAYDKQMPTSYDDETEMTQLVLPVLDEQDQIVTAINLADARHQPYPACGEKALKANTQLQTEDIDMS